MKHARLKPARCRCYALRVSLERGVCLFAVSDVKLVSQKAAPTHTEEREETPCVKHHPILQLHPPKWCVLFVCVRVCIHSCSPTFICL